MEIRKIILVILLMISIVNSEDSEESTAAIEEPADETTEEATTAEPEITEDNQEAAPKKTKKPEKPTKRPQDVPKENTRDENSCVPWPSSVRPLRECCLLPHNPLAVTLNSCFYRCTGREMDEKRQVECGASCFANVTGIFYDNHLNKQRVKSLMIVSTPNQWIRTVENAIDSCRIEEHASLHDLLARFFGCVTDFMTENCVQFIQSRECEATQEVFERCHHVKPPCDHWPFSHSVLDNCCKIPTLFSPELRNKCHHECTYSELFLQRQAKCDENCRYDDTKLRIDNRFNFEAVRGMLMQSAHNNLNWKAPIDHAVEKCKGILGTGKNIRSNSIDYEITTLQTCLREFLAGECVEFRDEPVCKKLKNFMNICPELRPRKTTHQFSQQYGRP